MGQCDVTMQLTELEKINKVDLVNIDEMKERKR